MKKWLALALVWLSVPTWGLPAETPHTGESALLDGPYEAQGPVLGGGNANPAIDKSQFSILRPTPAENLRDINALYNGPYTVDAGHVQIETVGVLYSYDRHSPSGTSLTTKYLSIGSTTVRLGLLNNWDVGVTFQPHVRLQTTDRATGVVTKRNGIGDLTLRTKLNLWGDDGGSSAFGIVGFLKLPTNQDEIGNRYAEGGIGFPIALELPWEWWLGITPEFDSFHDAVGRGYHLNFASTVFLWHKIAGNLSGYLESANWLSTERGSDWISTLDVGLTYVYGTHVQFDAGAFIGVTRAANDLTPFLGVSYRF